MSHVQTNNFYEQLETHMLTIVEKTALACAPYMGMGDVEIADQSAVDEMRKELNKLPIDGTIVIGEGEIDEAPMLYIGEKVGAGGEATDIAVDPLEGTSILAYGMPNSIAVITAAKKDTLLHAPDMYMDKIIVGSSCKGCIDIDAPVQANLESIANSLGRKVSDLTIVVLNRERHDGLIKEIREAGARIQLIGDGDITAAIAVGVRGTGVHAVMGIGGAPEGVIGAAAIKCLGGEMQAKLWPRNDEEIKRAGKMGITDVTKKLFLNDLVADDAVFAATGVTSGDLLKGVHFFGNGARTHSVIMSSNTGIIRFVDTIHINKNEPQGEIHL